MNNKKIKSQGKLASVAAHVLAAFLCCIGITAIFLSLFSLIMCKIDVPIFMIVPFATISVAAASFAAAAVLAYLEGSKGLLCGIITGLVIFLILWAASAIGGSFSLTGLAALKLIAYCSAGSIGGMLGVMLKEKKQKHR